VQLLLIFYNPDGVVVFSPGYTVVQRNGSGESLSRFGLANILATAPPSANRAALWVRKLPTDPNASQNDSTGWFTRPMLSEASPTQTGANAYAPGSGTAEVVATDARVSQQVTALSDATTAFGQRSANIEASVGAVSARTGAVETALTDGRFATAQRAATLEAQVAGTSASGLGNQITGLNNAVGAVDRRVTTINTALIARIEDRATAIADAKTGAVAQTVATLTAAYNGTAAKVTQQAGTIVDLQGKSSAYVRITTDNGTGIAQLSLWSDQYGGAWELVGDGRIRGNLLVDGTVTTAEIANGLSNTSNWQFPDVYASGNVGNIADTGTISLGDSLGGKATFTISLLQDSSLVADAYLFLDTYLTINGVERLDQSHKQGIQTASGATVYCLPLSYSVTVDTPLPFRLRVAARARAEGDNANKMMNLRNVKIAALRTTR
jgi:hypothetical protein